MARLKGKIEYYQNPYQDILDSELDKAEKARLIQERGEEINKQIDSDLMKDLIKNYAGAAIQIGSAAIPFTGGGRLAVEGAKLLKPMVGKAIANTIAKGTIAGAKSGAVEGFGRGLMEDENPLLTAAYDSVLGTLLGAGAGAIEGKITQKMAQKALKDADKVTLDQYYDDYIADLTNKTNAMAEYRAAKEGFEKGGKSTEFNTPDTETDAFKKWSGDYPIVKSEDAVDYKFKTGEGVTLEGYHGTKRGDRVGSEFKKERATSGPMAFFSSNEDIGKKYAEGKEDTSLADEMRDYKQWFKYRDKNGNLKPLGDSYWDMSFAERRAVDSNAPHITFDDTAENIIYDPNTRRGIGNYDYALKQYKGNPLKALVDGWLEGGSLYGREDDFLKVLEKAGVNMDNIDYIDPYTDHSKVYDVYLSMKKPLVTDDIPTELVDKLEQLAPEHPAQYEAYGDIWDKNTKDGVDWVNKLKNDIAAGENSYAWTSIPDWVTEEIQKAGFDGIIDVGGKSGGDIHKVYIPFEPTQIKSKQNQGTFDINDPNIYKALLGGYALQSVLNNQKTDTNTH